MTDAPPAVFAAPSATRSDVGSVLSTPTAQAAPPGFYAAPTRTPGNLGAVLVTPSAPAAPPGFYVTPTLTPGNVGTVLVTPSAPAAPLAFYTTPTRTPANVGSVLVTPGAPSAPIVPPDRTAPSPFDPPYINLAVYPSLVVSGSITPAAGGPLYRLPIPSTSIFPGGIQFTTTGDINPPSSGTWVSLYQEYLVTPASTTVEALAPKAGCTATGSSSTASRISVNNQTFSAPLIYWLYSNSGDPKWVLSGDGAMTDRGTEVIASGSVVFPIRIPGIGFSGGQGAIWQASPTTTWCWMIATYVDGAAAGLFSGIGVTPQTSAWSPSGVATGTPVVANGPSAPAAITA